MHRLPRYSAIVRCKACQSTQWHMTPSRVSWRLQCAGCGRVSEVSFPPNVELHLHEIEEGPR